MSAIACNVAHLAPQACLDIEAEQVAQAARAVATAKEPQVAPIIRGAQARAAPAGGRLRAVAQADTGVFRANTGYSK